jgi:hypothetical protein
MMNAAGRRAALLALLVLSPACGTDMGLSTAPTSTPPATVGVPPAFPAVKRSARIYVALDSSPLPSRYVLYDDGTFVLQYSRANLEYRGTYHEAYGAIAFEWEGWSVAGPWGATGSLSDDALAVRYNLIMQLSDFEDGLYIRAR